jgi:hypothetical protein
MMFPFPGEEEAIKNGIIDRVLFVSEFQQSAFAEMYRGIPSAITGNFIAPEDFPKSERKNQLFTLGRLSRSDADKWPLDFPEFYEELGLREVRYRVMAWGPELQKQYRWHKFGPEWDLLPRNKETPLEVPSVVGRFPVSLGPPL